MSSSSRVFRSSGAKLPRSLASAGVLVSAAVVACGAGDNSVDVSEQVASSPQAVGTFVSTPALVMGLKHDQNQTTSGTVMYSAPASAAIHRDGGDIGAGNQRGYEWWSLPDTPTSSSGYESKLPPGVVVALKHSSNQATTSITAFGNNPVTGPASIPGFQRQVGGDRGASSGVGYYWYESTGTSFTNWSGIDALLPKYAVVGLKHSQNQPNKTFRWNGTTYDPVKTSPVPPGFRRMKGGDLGGDSNSSFYWYEKTAGAEIVTTPSLKYPLSRSLFMGTTDPGGVDRDGDCLVDALEGELGTLLKPYVIFDNQENALQPGEPVGVFRVYPTSTNAVRVRYVLLFAQDGGYGPSNDNGCENENGHAGDNDTVDFDLTSSDAGRTWSMSKIELSFAGMNWPGNSRLESYSGRYPVVYASGSKHHEYFTRDNDGNDSPYSDVPYWDDCNDDVNGLGARALVTPFGLNGPRPNNVGEPARHPNSTFVNALDSQTRVPTTTYPGYTIWGGENFYGVGPNSKKFPPVTFPACAANGCSHSPCTEGAPLATSCFSDAATICNFDPYCCSTWWDSQCVTEVPSGCDAEVAPIPCGTVNENETLTLTCPFGQVISEVQFASYGLPTGQCSTGLAATSCHSQNSVQVLGRKCVGKRSCSVVASNTDFGDPCGGSIKRLSARVLCDTQPQPSASCGSLEAGEGFSLNQELKSCDSRFAWRLSATGDFSLHQFSDYMGGTMDQTIWGPYAQESMGGKVIMQLDGNLVFYDLSGNALWASGTNGYPYAALRLHNDGNLAIYDVNNVRRWTSNTGGR